MCESKGILDYRCEYCLKFICESCHIIANKGNCCKWDLCSYHMNDQIQNKTGKCLCCFKVVCIGCDKDTRIFECCENAEFICANCFYRKDVKRLQTYIYINLFSNVMKGTLYDKNVSKIIIQYINHV
jgi:hypothetical protein